MSYGSESKFSPGTRIADVREFITLLEFRKHGSWSHEGQKFEDYYWFQEEDYKSWSGIELTIYIDEEDGELTVSTRSVVARSYYDLVYQNQTLSALRKRFGGYFITDAGRNRFWHPDSPPPPSAASGCHLAYSRLGSNLIKVLSYLGSLKFPTDAQLNGKKPFFLMELDPRILSNNMTTSFLVSVVEDYLKSCFIALLKYSPNKEKFLRGIRLQGDQLFKISNGDISVEAAAAEMVSFQRISAACKHFQSIDGGLDLAATLRRPYRRRRKSFYDLLEELVTSRNEFVHKAKLDIARSTDDLIQLIYDLEVAMGRIERAFAARYAWPSIDKSWGIGRRP